MIFLLFVSTLLERWILQKAFCRLQVRFDSDMQWPAWAIYLSVAVVGVLGIGGMTALSVGLIQTLGGSN